LTFKDEDELVSIIKFAPNSGFIQNVERNLRIRKKPGEILTKTGSWVRRLKSHETRLKPEVGQTRNNAWAFLSLTYVTLTSQKGIGAFEKAFCRHPRTRHVFSKER
jgi:hypothetical protein